MTHEERNLNRREFIRLGAAGVAAASVGDLCGWAAVAVGGGKLPKRRYGRTGLEISRLVGAAVLTHG